MQRRTRHLLRSSLSSRTCAEDSQVRPCLLNENCFQFQYNLTGRVEIHSHVISPERRLMGECLCVFILQIKDCLIMTVWGYRVHFIDKSSLHVPISMGDKNKYNIHEYIAWKAEALTFLVSLYRKKCPLLAWRFSKAPWSLWSQRYLATLQNKVELSHGLKQ